MKYYVEFYDSVETVQQASTQPGLGMMEIEITHPVSVGETLTIGWTLDVLHTYKWVKKLPPGPYKVKDVLSIPGTKETKVEVYPAQS